MTDKSIRDLSGSGEAVDGGTTYTVSIGGSSRGLICRADQTVIQAMRASGRNDLSYGCQGGGCGACRVKVISGRYVSLPMSAACADPDQQRAGIVLACRIKPHSDIVLISAPLRRGTADTESRAA